MLIIEPGQWNLFHEVLGGVLIKSLKAFAEGMNFVGRQVTKRSWDSYRIMRRPE